MPHTLWIDRHPNGIDCKVTLQEVTADNKVIKHFDKLPARSGQYGYTDWTKDDIKGNWTQGKSPTPIGVHWMSTKREPLYISPVGTPFYIFSTYQGSRKILGPDGRIRENAGLHLENNIPGTVGCTALLHDTMERKDRAWALFSYLDKLHKFEPFIKVVVL